MSAEPQVSGEVIYRAKPLIEVGGEKFELKVVRKASTRLPKAVLFISSAGWSALIVKLQS